MDFQKTVVAAVQGMDVQDFLNHVAWAVVIKPDLLKTKEQLTAALVSSTLRPLREGEETREQIAGKLFGIDWTIKRIEELVSKGQKAKETLAEQNFHLQAPDS